MEVKILGNMVNITFILLNSAKMLSIVVVSIYTSTSSTWGILLFHIFYIKRLKIFVNVMDVKWFFIFLTYIFLILLRLSILSFGFLFLYNSVFRYFASFSVKFCLSFSYCIMGILYTSFFVCYVCCKYLFS